MSAMTAFADEVKRVRKLGVATGDIATATGSQPATVNSWARATRQPSAASGRAAIERGPSQQTQVEVGRKLLRMNGNSRDAH